MYSDIPPDGDSRTLGGSPRRATIVRVVDLLETTVRLSRHFGRIRSLIMITIAELRAIAELRINAVDAPKSIPADREDALGLTDLEQRVIADSTQIAPIRRISAVRSGTMVHVHGLWPLSADCSPQGGRVFWATTTFEVVPSPRTRPSPSGVARSHQRGAREVAKVRCYRFNGGTDVVWQEGFKDFRDYQDLVEEEDTRART
jgi:hypothetical protein